MKKRFLVTIVSMSMLMTMMLGLVACGGSKDTASNDVESTEIESTTVEPTTAEPTTEEKIVYERPEKALEAIPIAYDLNLKKCHLAECEEVAEIRRYDMNLEADKLFTEGKLKGVTFCYKCMPDFHNYYDLQKGPAK